MLHHTEHKKRPAGHLSPLERIGRGIEQMLESPKAEPIAGSRSWLPELRVVNRRREVFIRVISPDFDPRKIRIQLSGRVLTLSAALHDRHPEHHGYHAFKRSIVLPVDMDWRHTTAQVRGQELIVRIRKLAGPPPTPRKVRDIMTRDVRFVTPETPVAEAASLLRTFDIGSVPVCRDRKVVGILTDRDIAMRVTAQSQNPNEVRVGDVMTPDPLTCGEDDLLVDAEEIMCYEQVRRLPVVDGQGLLVGYLSLAKVARHEHDLRSGHVLRGVSEPAPHGGAAPPA